MFEKKNAVRNLWIVAVCLWLFVIWGNSLQPADQSNAKSLYALALLEKMLGWLDLNFIVTNNLIRKLGHFVEFMVLGTLLFKTISVCSPSIRLKKRYFWFGFLLLLAASIDEGIQLFVEGRSSQVTDILLDVTSGFLATVLFFLLPKRFSHKKCSS